MTTSRGILLATVLSGAMAIIFGIAITLALPAIQSHFNAGFTSLQWIVTAYTLTLGVLILMSGALGDIFGPKRVFVTGLAIFILASLLSAFAPSLNLLIIFQVIMGLGAALVVPGSLTIINTCIEKEQRGRAIGLWTGFITGGAVVAPFIGGSLVETFSWPAVFFFNVLLGTAALLVSLFFIPADRELRQAKIDWLGIILISASLFGITYGLIQTAVFSISIGLVLLPLFFLWQTSAPHPLVPRPVLKNPLVRSANLATLLIYTSLNGLIFYIILYFQQILNFSPLTAGLALMPAPLLVTILAGPFGAWTDKVGPRLPMTLGPAFVTVAFLLLTQVEPNSNYFTSFLPALVLNGLGMAITVAPLTKSALNVAPRHSGVASGVNNAIARLAAPIAIAVFGLFVKDSLAAAFPLIMLGCAALAAVSTVTSYLTIGQVQLSDHHHSA